MGIYLLRSGLQLEIRRGIVTDAPKLVPLVDKCAGQSDFLTFNSGEYITNDAQRDLIIEHAEDKNGLLLIAEINEQLVGTLIFRRRKRPKVSHGGEFGIIVEQGSWGLGIGKRLIQELMQWAKEIGEVRKINLIVRDDNERGIALYKTLGFVEEGRMRRESFSKGIFYDAIFMGICID
jgi:RimJ/RimL family protein N-acetyltransferase